MKWNEMKSSIFQNMNRKIDDFIYSFWLDLIFSRAALQFENEMLTMIYVAIFEEFCICRKSINSILNSVAKMFWAP